MIKNDFYGTKFCWWTGIVADRTTDKLMVGRIRVRIIGLHAEDTPKEHLPWAQMLYPTNAAKLFSTPVEGDWVFGFFMDGENAQMPIVVGVYNGTENSAYAEKPEKLPEPPEDVIIKKDNQPINPRPSWEQIDKTMIDKMNFDLSTIKDVSANVDIHITDVKEESSTTLESEQEEFRGFLREMAYWPPNQRVNYQEQKEEIAAEKKKQKMKEEDLEKWKEKRDKAKENKEKYEEALEKFKEQYEQKKEQRNSRPED